MENVDDLILRIRQEIETSPIQKLKVEMGNVSAAMSDLVTKGQRNSAVYQDLIKLSGELANKSKVLKNEQKGIAEGTPKVNQLAQHFDKLNKSLQDQRQNGTSLAATWGIISGAIMVGINYLKQYAKEFYTIIKTGLEFANLYNHFVKINGGIEQATKNLQLFDIAASGNMGERELIEFANEMTELKYSTEETAKILDLAERKSDELGRTLEAGTDVVLKFIETGKGRQLYRWGMDIGAINQEMVKLSGVTEENIGKLTVERQQRLRSAAVLNLYGDSIENINKKAKDNADKLAAMEKGLKDVEIYFGKAFGDKVFNHIDKINKGLTDLGIVTEKNKITSKDLGDALGQAFGKVLPFITGGALGILISQLDKIAKGFNIVKNAVYNVGSALRTPISDKFTSTLLSVVNPIIEKVKDAYRWVLRLLNITGTKKTTDSKVIAHGTGKDVGNETYVGMSENISDEEYQEIQEKRKKEKTKSSGKTKTEKEEEIDQVKALVNEINLELSKDKEKLHLRKQEIELLIERARKLQAETTELDKQKQLQDEINKLIELRDERFLSPERMKKMGVVTEDETSGREYNTLERPLTKLEEMKQWFEQNKDLPFFKKIQDDIVITENLMTSFGDGFRNIFEGIAKGGEDSEAAVKETMKSIIKTFLTGIEIMLIGSSGDMFAKAIATFGASLITDAPWLALGFAALETAKIMVGNLETGGHFTPGIYNIEEAGGEIAVFNKSGYMLNHRDLNRMLNSWSSGGNAVPNVEVNVKTQLEKASVQTMLKENMPIYNNRDRKGKIIKTD